MKKPAYQIFFIKICVKHPCISDEYRKFHISQLELKVKDLKGENSELYNVVKKLKQSVANLKQEVIDHCNSGCQINGDVLNFSTS